MNDLESQEWWAELREMYKTPDVQLRECCLAVALGGLEKLRADIHIGNFHGLFELSINYCPHCGRDMNEYREIVRRKILEQWRE
jgi:hypothetical protein